jgi:hypothetical protein
MMQQLQQHQQQMLEQQQANEEYLNALKSQAYATIQQQQNHQTAMNPQLAPTLPTRRKKAAAKKNLQNQQQPQQNFQQQQQTLLQQQQFQQQFIQAAANARIEGNNQAAGIDALSLDMNDPHIGMFASTKPLVGMPGIDVNALTNLDLSKVKFQ